MTLVLLLIVLIVIGHAYSNWSGKTPTGLIGLSEYFQRAREKGRFWELLQILTVPLVFAYNQLLLLVWLASGILVWANWCFQNLLVDGVWLLARLFIHYFIVWPWRLIRLAFEQVRASWSMRHYKLGSLGIFSAGAVFFLGRYLTMQWGLPVYLNHVFSVLSILPLAWIFSKIASIRHSEKHGGDSDNRTPVYLLVFLGTALGALILNFLLYFIASRTFLSPILASVSAGGSVLLSAALIFNCIIVFFLLSVMPTHLLYEKGNFMQMVKSTLGHLKNKWPQYLFGALVSVVPAFILTLLPALLLTGSVRLASEGAEREFKRHIESRKQALKAIEPKFDVWIDRNRTTEEEMDSLILAYGEFQEEQLAIKDLELVTSNVKSTLSPYGRALGTLPVAAVYKTHDLYHSTANRLVGSDPAVGPEGAVAHQGMVAATCEKDISSANSLKEKLTRDIKDARDYKNRLENELEDEKKKCEGTYCDPAPPSLNTVQQSPSSSKTEIDRCPRIKVLEEKIKEETKRIDMLESHSSNLSRLRDAIVVKNEQLSDNGSFRNLAFAIGYFLLGLIVCAIVALIFAFAPVLFALNNYAIYHEDKNQNEWKVSELINEANSRNANQPLLGILLSPFTLTALIWISSQFLKSIGIPSDKITAIKPMEIIKQSADGNMIKERISTYLGWFPLPVQLYELEKKLQGNLMEVYAGEKGSEPDQKEPAITETTSAPETDLPEAPAAAEPAIAESDSFMTGQELSIEEVLMEQERLLMQAEEGTPETEAPMETVSSEPQFSPDNDRGYSYYVLVNAYSGSDEAESSAREFASRGIRLNVISPGSFMGENSQYYLLCAGFDVNLSRAEEIKRRMAEKGLNCSIHRF